MPRLSPFRPILRAAIRPLTSTTPVAAPASVASTSYTRILTLTRTPSSNPPTRSFTRTSTPITSLLSSSRSPILSLLSSSTTSTTAVAANTAATNPLGQQVRCVTYGSEYQPSQRIRKRRHGFLARIKTRNGRKTIMRRKFRGKAKLSH
ncbi:related to 50S ribosomal protein L34 [Ustilago trichophora]|uniref:Large ribosomal subunit protein bL34m n=1 Tax=Ustilago trichophora TaxID=86804 RepID=A0A5C3E7F8_9BASI|nr:related to 50S ribosomal protein L34 [Ustilago trichophora]